MQVGYECLRFNTRIALSLGETSLRIAVFVVSLPYLTGWSQSQKEAEHVSKALAAIEAKRGGRHWADAPTAPPMSPEESLAAMRIESGYEIELVAAEPLVQDPVSIAFDAQGRMFVAEFSDYPEGPAEGQTPLSKIVMLEDLDGDGVMDRRHVFADGLNFANSIMPYRDGLLVGAKTEILFLKDNDGDHIADQREVLFDGFTPAHAQMQICCPRWGIDNKIYCNYGPGQVAHRDDPDQRVALPRKDFWFDPISMRFGSDSGLGQFGNTVDRWGRRYYCLNRNPIMTTLLSPEVLQRNPYHIVTKPFYDVGKAGGETRVYPLVKMKSNYLSHAGTHTAACGTTAYLGELGDDDFHNSVFVCEPIGHLVTRSIVKSAGLRLVADRAEPERDFLASTDTWFRPAALANGPDGALYLADMYRLWVEHPKFLPPDVAAKLEWRAGEDRGRIYRIVPVGAEPRRFRPPGSPVDAAALLADPNGWRQFLGQRLLVEQQSVGTVRKLRVMLRDSELIPTARLHALWTLAGLSALQSSDLRCAVEDPHPQVRMAAAQLAYPQLPEQKLLEVVLRAAGDRDIRVRFQAALTLAASSDNRATRQLVELAIRDGSDPLFTDGLLTSVANRSTTILSMLLDDDTFRGGPTSERRRLVKQLAAITAARGDKNELATLLELISEPKQPRGDGDTWWRLAAVGGLATGLPRHRGRLGKQTLARLLDRPPDELEGYVQKLRDQLSALTELAVAVDHEPVDRAAAIELLGHRPLEEIEPTVRELLAGHQPATVQWACVQTLARHAASGAVIMIDHWPELKPTARAEALSRLLRRKETTRAALQAMADGRMDSAGLGIDQRVLLLKHADDSIRQLAVELFGESVSADRRQVAKRYGPALTTPGDALAGRQVFQRVCAACHRRSGVGHEVGPDLSDTRNRSRDALLFDILDPNAKVEPRYTTYSVLTQDGRLFSGLLETDTADAIVILIAGGKRETIPRANIESIKVSENSLMPEGVEQDISVSQMADLLAYLKSEDLN